ncbi:MAG: LacI family DNA-binding transcriptional regulator [Phycicoccus sp.]
MANPPRADLATAGDAGDVPVRQVDVARTARVSTATVSRVLNGHAVDPVLAERVRKAVRAMDYRPNAVARNLRRRRTRVWAMIIADITNPFHTSLVRGVEDVASEAGYSVLLGNSDEDAAKEREYLEVAHAEQVAGLVITPFTPATDVAPLMRARVPIVAVDRPLLRSPSAGRGETPEVLTDTIGTNSAVGAATATEHLLEHGWRRPACITGPVDSITGAERARGYAGVMRRYAAVPLIRHTSFSADGGRAAAADLLLGEDRPDSLFVANATLTLGVLAAIADLGLRIGVDIGLVGFDDSPWAPLIAPPLTVVRQPSYELGVAAGKILLDRLEGRAAEPSVQLTLPTSLVERASCRRRSEPETARP